MYLGGFKVAVVMWLYGIEKFSTDIQFLLGFKPTQFWTTCWAMHPILTFVSFFVYITSKISFIAFGFAFTFVYGLYDFSKCEKCIIIILTSICLNISRLTVFVFLFQFFIVHKLYVLINLTEKVQMILASTWILFSFCFVTIIQIKTIAKFIVRNVSINII